MTALSALRCACGSDRVFSIRPGQDAVWGHARDAEGNVTTTIMIQAPVSDRVLCISCFPRRRAA